MNRTAKASASAAEFVDAKLQVAAEAVDRFANVVGAATSCSDGSGSGGIADPIRRRLEKTASQLHAQSGDKIVSDIKGQMLKYPRATVGFAAAAAAIAAQAVLSMLKSEQEENDIKQAKPSMQKRGSNKKKLPPQDNSSNDDDMDDVNIENDENIESMSDNDDR